MRLVVDVVLNDLSLKLFAGIGRERKASSEQLEGHHTHRPNVAAKAIVLSLKDLRSHEEWRATHELGTFSWINVRYETQVAELYFAQIILLLQQDILWLDVSMNEAHAVQIVQSEQHLANNTRNLTLTHSLPLLDNFTATTKAARFQL